MVKKRKEDIEDIVDVQETPYAVRCLSIVAHVDHGKSTLADSLMAGAGELSSHKAGNARKMDTLKEEQERGVTIKSTGATLLYRLAAPDFVPSAGSLDSGDAAGAPSSSSAGAGGEEDAPATLPFVINVVDTPGHVDFSAEVTASLRLTDGAVVVVDCMEGPRVQTKTVIRQALGELVKPVLCINKVDRFILEKQYEPEEAYAKFVEVIDACNEILNEYDAGLNIAEEDGHTVFRLPEHPSFNPRLGNVMFASGKQGWGFTLADFAAFYASKLGSTPKKWMKRLWGNFWYDPEAAKFVKSPVNANGDPLPRGFSHFVLRPIWEMFSLSLDPNASRDAIAPVLTKYGVPSLSSDDYALLESAGNSAFLERVMKSWLPAGPALARMAVTQLPSPVEAQPYRIPYLYQGDLDTPVGQAMLACDPEGPLVMFVSKMVPDDRFTSFYAFGRVFSGRATPGAKVFAMGPDYVHHSSTSSAAAEDSSAAADTESGASASSSGGRSKKKRTRTAITATSIWLASTNKNVSRGVPAGSTVGLSGLDGVLLKTGTVTDHPDAGTIRAMSFSVSPVVRVAVRPEKATDLKAFVTGLTRLDKSDPSVVISRDPVTKETIIAGSGSLHLEVSLNSLRDVYAGVPIVAGDPIVTFAETILAPLDDPVLKRSSNKHNRVFASVAPMEPGLVTALDAGDFGFDGDAATRNSTLASEFGWSKDEAKSLLAWGEPSADYRGNVLLNESKGVNYIADVADSLSAGFQSVISSGPLCGEPVRGVRFSIVDGMFHGDSTHRGPRHVEPTASAAFRGAMLSAQPRLLEPVYAATVLVPQDAVGAVYRVLAPRRGVINAQEIDPSTGMELITADLPVVESFSFLDDLRDASSGKASAQLSFSHWALIDEDPYEEGTLAHSLISDIRARKGLAPAIPQAEDVVDRQ